MMKAMRKSLSGAKLSHMEHANSGDPDLKDSNIEKRLSEDSKTIASLTHRVQELEAQLKKLLEVAGNQRDQVPKNGSLYSKQHVPDKVTLELRPGEVARALPTVLHMAATRVVMHQVVLPSDVDMMGICFGGQVMSWIDICAGLAAKSVAGGPCVTASVDSVHFLRPCHLGCVCIIGAMVNRTFASSMEVGVRVEEEDSKTGIRKHCCSAYLTFVSVWAKARDGTPARPLPRMEATDKNSHRIFEAAELRRVERLELRKALKNDPDHAAPRLKPITHREADATLAPAVKARFHAYGEPRECVSPDQTMAHMTQLIMPQHANSVNITFGGQVMKWMELCAYIAAGRVGRGTHLLTGSMDSIAFAHPTRVGDSMYISAQVTGIFGSSMEVMISVYGETSHIGEVFHCGDGYATVVSVDGEGLPVEVPFVLCPQSPEEHLRCADAVKRRDGRLQMRHSLAERQLRRPSLDGSWRNRTLPDFD